MALLTPDQLYAISSIIMVGVTVALAVAVSRIPADRRRYYLPLAILPGMSAIAMGMVSQGIFVPEAVGGGDAAVPRMAAYAALYPTIMVYLGWAGGLSWRSIGILAGLMLTVVGITTANWFITGIIVAVGMLVMLGSLIATAYLLLGPYARIAAEQSGERHLLYSKLRNLVLLLWASLVVIGLFGPQAVGLMDRFVAVFVGNYIDVLSTLGFALIVLRARDAMDQIFEQGDHQLPAGVVDERGEPAD